MVVLVFSALPIRARAEASIMPCNATSRSRCVCARVLTSGGTATSGASTAGSSDTSGLPTGSHEAWTNWAQPQSDWTSHPPATSSLAQPQPYWTPATWANAPNNAQTGHQHQDWSNTTGHQTWPYYDAPETREPTSAGPNAQHENQPLVQWNSFAPPPSKKRCVVDEVSHIKSAFIKVSDQNGDIAVWAALLFNRPSGPIIEKPWQFGLF